MALLRYDFETGDMSQYDPNRIDVRGSGIKPLHAPPRPGTNEYGGYIDPDVKRVGNYSWHVIHDYNQTADVVTNPTGAGSPPPSIWYTPGPNSWGVESPPFYAIGTTKTIGCSFRLPTDWVDPPGWGFIAEWMPVTASWFNGSFLALSFQLDSLRLSVTTGRGDNNGNVILRPSGWPTTSMPVVIPAPIPKGVWHDLIVQLKMETGGNSGPGGALSTNDGGPQPGHAPGQIKIWWRQEGSAAFTAAYQNTDIPTLTWANTTVTDSGGFTYGRCHINYGHYHKYDGVPGSRHEFNLDSVCRSTLEGDAGYQEVLSFFTSTVGIVGGGGGGGTGGGTGGSTVALPTVDIFGKTAVGVSRATMPLDAKRGSRFRLGEQADVKRVYVYLKPRNVQNTNQHKLLVYTDSSGPAVLKATSAELVVAGTDTEGWYAADISPVVRLDPGFYWLALINGDASSSPAAAIQAAVDTVVGALAYNTDTYSDGPAAPFGAFSVGDQELSIAVEYDPVVTTGPDATLGKTAVGASTSTAGANFKFGNKVSVPAGKRYRIQKITARISGVGGALSTETFRAYVYDDASAVPGAKLSSASAEVTVQSDAAVALVDFTFPTPVDVTAPSGSARDIWLILHTGGAAAAQLYYDSSANAEAYNADAYADGATDPYGAATLTSKQYTLYATYSEVLQGGSGGTGFPTPGLLDSGNRADEAPLSDSSRWASPMEAGAATLRLTGGQVAMVVSAPPKSQGYRTDVSGADLDVYCDISVLPASANSVGIWARIQSPGTGTAKAYLLAYTVGTGFRYFRFDGAGPTYTQIGSTIATPVLSAGDRIGFRVQGTTLTGYYLQGAGAWTALAAQADSNVTGAGTVGVELNDTTARLDNIGGGALATALATRMLMGVGR